MRLGKAQIKGLYSLSVPSSDNSTSEKFELYLLSNLIYTHRSQFSIEDGKVIFGESVGHRLLFDVAKVKYGDLPSVLKENVNPKLLDAVTRKIYEQVQQKLNLDNESSLIKSEIALRYRAETAERLEKAIADVFEDVHQNAFNVFYYDFTNFVVSTYF